MVTMQQNLLSTRAFKNLMDRSFDLLVFNWNDLQQFSHTDIIDSYLSLNAHDKHELLHLLKTVMMISLNIYFVNSVCIFQDSDNTDFGPELRVKLRVQVSSATLFQNLRKKIDGHGTYEDYATHSGSEGIDL